MRILFLVLVIFFITPAWAQELNLTYEEAVKIALDQNVDLRVQQNNMKVVKAQQNQSRGSLAPTISANMNAYISNGNTFLEQEGININTTSESLSGSLNANLNVFSGFSQYNRIKLYNAQFDAQQHLITRTSQDVIGIVTTQYLQVLLDTELLEIANDNLKTQELLYKQIEAMVEAGSKPKSDLYDQMATVKNNELLVLQAKNSLSNDKSNLAITLQLDPTVELTVNDPNWELNEIRFSQLDLEDLYDVSLSNRSDLKQYRSSEIAAEKSVSIAKAAFAPSLYAFYNFNTVYNDQAFRTLEQQLITDNKRDQYGFRLSIPIYSGLRNKTQLVYEKVNYENSKINTENLKKTILNDVRNAYQNFLDVRSSYEVSIAQFDAANMSLKVQQEKYNLGVGSLIELTNANNNFVFAASRQAQARLNLLFQKVTLDYYTGTLDIP